MDRLTLQELNMTNREDVVSFLKKLWNGESVCCPICGCELELLHKKAKKSVCDRQCKTCNKTVKLLHLLDELNEQMPD